MGRVGAPTRRARLVCPIPLARDPPSTNLPRVPPLSVTMASSLPSKTREASGVKTLASCMHRPRPGVWPRCRRAARVLACS